MQSTTTHKFPVEIKDWLNKRTLKDETIERFRLYWNERDEIVIPIHDKDGNFLFNKYRKNPFEVSDKPKYRYEKGAKSVLYNLETLKDADHSNIIYIQEGELDCIAVENLGYHAVTTTGGASTFEPEWVEELKDFEHIAICFDSDVAGIKGAIYVQSLIPRAHIIILPLGIKDMTEFLIKAGKYPKEAFVSLKAERFFIPTDLQDRTEKKEVKQKVKEFKDACNAIQGKKREAIKERQPTFHLDIMNEYLANRYALYSRAEKNLGRRPYTGSGDKVRQAKLVPITNYVNFNNDGYACCLWHQESTPSMFYNNENSRFPNTVKCFGGCGIMGDTIDVIMELKKVDFNTAVKIILNEI